MNKIIKWVILAVALVSIGAVVYHYRKSKTVKKPYQTIKLKRRTIKQVVKATGTLEAKGTINVGSLITGVVQEIIAEENQQVKKGHLLATIDNGKGDTDVKRAAGVVKIAKSEFEYQTAFFGRQEKLYQLGQISKNEYQQSLNAYQKAKANLEEQTALHEKAVIDFNNTKITSPIDGIVIKKHVSLRQGVANFSPPTILYTLAEDIRTMNVELEIDETDIGFIKVGQKARLTFDTYPHKNFYGTISEISIAPLQVKPSVVYKATIVIDNKKQLFKPGMTANAQITITKKKNALSIPVYLFSLNKQIIKHIAKQGGYTFKPLTEEKREAFKKTQREKQNRIKTLWTVDRDAFIEKPVEIGISDNAFFEILSGLDGSENVLIDVEEPDKIKRIYEQYFKGSGLGQK